MDGWAWQAVVHGTTKSQTWLSTCVRTHTHTHTLTHSHTHTHSHTLTHTHTLLHQDWNQRHSSYKAQACFSRKQYYRKFTKYLSYCNEDVLWRKHPQEPPLVPVYTLIQDNTLWTGPQPIMCGPSCPSWLASRIQMTLSSPMQPSWLAVHFPFLFLALTNQGDDPWASLKHSVTLLSSVMYSPFLCLALLPHTNGG